MQVTFTTNHFEIVPGEDDATNPGCYGQSLANWLADKLAEQGCVIRQVAPDDFGWVVLIDGESCPTQLACGNIDKTLDTWSIVIEPRPSLLQRLLSRPDTIAASIDFRAMLTKILQSIPDAAYVTWLD